MGDKILIPNQNTSDIPELVIPGSTPNMVNTGILLPDVERTARYISTANAYSLMGEEFTDANSERIPLIEDIILRLLLTKMPYQGRILDIGCGAGIYSAYMGLLGYKVHGLDISDGQIYRAKSLVSLDSNIQFSTTNILDWNPQFAYDGILINSMFHHILKQDTNRFLQVVKKSLSPQGKALLIVRTHPASEEKFVTKTKLGKPTARITSRYTTDELYNVLTKNGFLIAHDETYPHTYDREGDFHHILLEHNHIEG